MIYKTFKQWKNGKFLEHFGPRKANYTQDEFDLIEMGWKYGYDAGAEAEREACAKICETESKDSIMMNSQICSSVNIVDIHEAYREGRSMGAGLCGQAIRARGKK